MKKILVTAATGHLGGAVVDFLTTRVPAGAVTAMARDVAKAEHLKAKGVAVRQGDYYDKASLLAAFKDIDTLLFVSSGSLEDRLGQHLNVVEAARASGIRHIVYTSVVRADPATRFTPGADHHKTEEAIKGSGIPYTMFRNTFYIEVFPMLLGNAMTSGEWYYAAGNARANFASRADMAEALANVLAAPHEHVNKVYEITAAKAYTFEKLAEVLSTIAGKTITYTSIPFDALRDGLVKSGLPEVYVPVMVGMAEAIATGEFDIADPSLENLLKRKPVDIAEYLPTLLKA